MTSRVTKIFDPADGFAPLRDPIVVTDASVVKREGRWWMYLAGKVAERPGIQIFSASLEPGAPLSASGWKLTASADDPTRLEMPAGQEASAPWDLEGGRHCPSYVRGFDAARGEWVERIYYAGGAKFLWGPYTIGYLEWDGGRWVDQPAPVFTAEEDWEHASVYEPNLIYADGKWKMWYVAGSNVEDYIVHGFAESADGRTGWTKHQMVFPPEEKVFDFAVTATPDGFEAVYSRVWLEKSEPPAATGLWWVKSKKASPDMRDWSEPVQIMTAEDCGWHAGPWKPSVVYGEDVGRMFVFFDGAYTLAGGGPFPYAFTCGCLEVEGMGE